jgi:hypothetical protein
MVMIRAGKPVPERHFPLTISSYEGVYDPMFQMLLDFGYGLENCDVYNYWDRGYPLARAGYLVDQKGTSRLMGLMGSQPVYPKKCQSLLMYDTKDM